MTTAQYCHHCSQLTNEPIVVTVIHAASGPGHTVYACPENAPPPADTAVPPAAGLDTAARHEFRRRTP